MSEQPQEGAVLETGKRLSESATWRLQRELFDRAGVKAWSDGKVPFHITSNAYIAEQYLWVAIRFIQDCVNAPAGSPLALDPARPIYIVELGAGHGYFGYLFLCKLLEARERIPFAMPPVCYVLTDFTESNLDAWKNHERLRPFFDAGMLDLARFDAEHDRELRLQRSGVVLSRATPSNPILFVANYVFDSLSHDVFRIQRGQLEEGITTLRLGRAEGARDQELLEHVDVSYDYRPVADAAAYYPDDPSASRILADYSRRLGDTAFAFPLGGLRCLQHLANLSANRMMMITADKGYSRELDLLGLANPSIAHHHSVSMMVNYHALGELMIQRGGFMLTQDPRNASLEICLLAVAGGAPLPETRLAFDQMMERVGPTDVYRLFDQLPLDKLDLDQLLAVLRMTAWDPVTFISMSRDLNRVAGDAYLEQLSRLREALQKVWALHFPLPNSRDVAFEIGYVYYAMRRYREAMAFYQRSLALYGNHQTTLFNLGLCEYQQGRLDEALGLFDRALEHDPSYAPARDWRMRVQGERARAGAMADESDDVAAEPVRPGLLAGEQHRAAPVVVGVADGEKPGVAPGVAERL
jgi:tetratricopeptide (TPR) repeat protein